MTLKFLIVDDSKAMQTIVKRILISAGFEEHEFRFQSNGRDALEIIRTWSPDLVLLDWHMPEMTGIELLEKVRELNLSTKIGLITAEKNKLSIARAIKAGALFVINKPFTAENLKDNIIPALTQGGYVEPLSLLDKPILFPPPTAMSTVLSLICNQSIQVSKIKPLTLEQLTLPCTLALFGDSNKKVKLLQLLEADTKDRLAEAFASSVYQNKAIDDKLLAKATVSILSIIAANCYNIEENRELTLIKTYNIPKLVDKVNKLNQAVESSRLDLKFEFNDGQISHAVFYLESQGGY
ncbi:response regulator transcription factor [Aliikangiella maris]|uniref:Response regulator n=2 Tax=Aliikangiella maris TaxID=3162458 RepID=A0ABV2BSH9_9GAMM